MTRLELESAIEEVKDSPTNVNIHRRPLCGFDDDLTCRRLGHGAQIAGHRKDIGVDVVLCIGHRRTRQRIAELSEAIVLVDDAADQVAILIIITGFLLVACCAEA